MHVNIKNGTYRGQKVSGIFPFIKKLEGRGVRVRTNGHDPFITTNALINVAENSYFFCDSDGNEVPEETISAVIGGAGEDINEPNYEQKYLSIESEEDAINRIRKTFSMLDTVVNAALSGIVRGLVISGPPGIGKSYGVRSCMEISQTYNKLRNNNSPYKFISGSSTPINLYKMLYLYRKKGDVIVLDDCDNVLFDEVSLNLLKVALDTGDKRIISWLSESRVLKEEEIPNEFEFNGSVIFLTNIDFAHTKASRIKQHLDAIQSRCHYMDLEISHTRDKILRIKQVVSDGMLDSYNLTDEQKKQIMNYIEDNSEYLREVTLRMVKKIADIIVMSPNNWVDFVEATCLRREAKYKRLLENKDK